MKRIISLMLAILTVMMLFAGCDSKQDPNAPDGYQIASGEDADYTLFVPMDWIVEKSTLYTSAYFSKGKDATSISVTAFGADFADPTVEAWWAEYSEEFAATFSSFEVVSEEDAKLGGLDAKKYTFTATLGKGEEAETSEDETTAAAVSEGKYNFVCVATVKDTYIYYMLYTSTPEYFETHLDTLGEVINYFEFK